jgi:very-short-patch-repair endonuclease
MARPMTDEEVCSRRDAVSHARRKGYDVLRFTNDDVFHNLDGVLETIYIRLIALRPRTDDSAI